MQTHRLTILLVVAGLAVGGEAPSWPNWRGPTGSGSVDDPGVELVDDLGKARRVWQSETRFPMPYGRGQKGKPVDVKVNGGFCDPIVADGKVFLYHTRPAGPVAENYHNTDDAKLAKYREKLGDEAVELIGRIAADDVFTCLDAATGEQVWQRAFAEKGFNYCDLRCYPHSPQCIPAYADGRLYGQGSAGKVYAMDAATGEPLWEADSGPKVAALEAVKAKFVAEKKKPLDAGGGPWSTKMKGIGSIFDHSVLAVDGVVVVGDSHSAGRGSGHGMAGFDGETGKELWRVPGCLSKYASPIRWTSDGVGHAIGAGPKLAVCVEAKTGKVAWKIEGEAVHVAGGTPAVWQDYLVLCARAGKQNKKAAAATAEADGITCYRLSPAGAEKAWAFKGKDGSHGDSSVILHRGHMYAKLRGKYSCVDLATGEIVATLEGRGAGGYAPCAANGRIISSGSTYINADPKDFRLLEGNKQIRLGSYVHPVIAGGRLYTRGAHHLHCWDLRK